MRVLALLFTSVFVVAASATITACGALKTAPADDSPDDASAAEDAEDGGSDPPRPSDAPDAAADATSDASCGSKCARRSCGRDPVCDVSCGECPAAQACDETSTGASCKAATIIWQVDGVVITKLATYEAFYTASSSTYSLFFNKGGRNIQISFSGEPSTGTLARCPTGGSASLSLLTSDNGWAKLDALPARWKNLGFVSCGAQRTGDIVTARDLTITSASPARVAGSYEFIVQGGGARAGSTLRVHGVFDVTPQEL